MMVWLWTRKQDWLIAIGEALLGALGDRSNT